MNNNLEFNTHITQALSEDLLFACFSYPGSNTLHFMSQNDAKISFSKDVDKESQTGFIFHPFENNNKAIWIKGDIYFNDSSHSIPDVQSVTYDAHFQSQIRPSLSKENYLSVVNELIKSIKNKEAEKVVFSRSQEIEISRNELFDAFIKLNEQHNDVFVFLVNLPGNVSWLGASPEILVSEYKGECESVALAATRPASEGRFEWTDKELEEQAYVSRYIEKVLVENNILYQKADLQEKILKSGLKHLCQDFKFKLPESASFWNIVYNLHPTPAVCGIPVKKSMDLINKVENYKREYYAGFLGPVNLDERTNLYVNLRSAQVAENSACLYVGGGITADSNPDSEWVETELKSLTILNAFKKEVN